MSHRKNVSSSASVASRDDVSFAEVDVAEITLSKEKSDKQYVGIRQSVASLKPYLSRRIRIKFQSVQLLEVFPNGERGEIQAMTMTQLLAFVYTAIPEADVHRNAALVALAMAEKEGKKPVTSTGVLKDGGDIGNKEGPGDHGSRNVVRQHSDFKELQYNDLRYLMNQFHTHEEPMILVRKHAVLISLNPLRAIITADRLILVSPNGAESLLYILHDYMKGIIEDSDTIFSNQSHKSTPELRGYMAMLATITALHQQDYTSLGAKIESALYNFKSLQNITADMQDTLRVLKNAVLSQIIKINSYRKLLKNLFSNEDDLALMNLSLLKESPHLYRKPLTLEVLNQQDDISNLIESYLMDHHAIGTKLEFLKAQIQSSEELVSFRLDMYRNDLLFVEMTLIIFMLALAVGGFVTGSFGMNLNNGLPQDDPYIFWFLSLGLSVVLIGFTYVLIARYRLTGSVPVTIEKS